MNTTLSVRGEAQVVVAPDSVELFAELRAVRESKSDALAAAAAALNLALDDLAAIGGEPSTVDNERTALTWSARSVTTHAEYDHDKRAGSSVPTGRFIAQVALSITVRAFALLDEVANVLARHETLNVTGVSWLVDRDNPEWRSVRTAAIHAAIDKARDYAAALGGELGAVEHIADAGLLGSTSSATPYRASGGAPGLPAGSRMSGAFVEEPDTPSLDPVPQALFATVDARFSATVASL